MFERTRCPLNLPMSRKWQTYLHGQRLERPSDLQAAWPRGQRTIICAWCVRTRPILETPIATLNGDN